MRNMTVWAALAATVALGTACNDEWKDEQYRHYVSFSTQLDDQGVTAIYVPFSRHNEDGSLQMGEGLSNYELPVLISGSTMNDRNITVHVAHDPDTLDILNEARFATREELYYKDMVSDADKTYASWAETVEVKAGTNKSLLTLNFDFNGIDMAEKWVLPLQIVDDPSYGYESHPRKNYAKAMLRIYPFNDYTGDYSGSTITTKVVLEDDSEVSEAITTNTIRGYAVSENSIFTYAGFISEEYTDRFDYKIVYTFNDDGTITLSCPNADEIQFETDPDNPPMYRVNSSMDASRPYLMHRYVTVTNIDYYFNYMPKEGVSTRYHVKGLMTLSRDINTQIPDEDQAIEW